MRSYSPGLMFNVRPGAAGCFVSLGSQTKQSNSRPEQRVKFSYKLIFKEIPRIPGNISSKSDCYIMNEERSVFPDARKQGKSVEM